jgi:tetratricopeptide (TPR) repeat protein
VAEVLSGVTVPYLKFHPILAPVLWQELEEEVRKHLQARHRESYCELSFGLYQLNNKNPLVLREIARREFPNLIRGVYQALDGEEEWAIEFANNVNLFLSCLGLNRDFATLTDRLRTATVEVGSHNWYLSQFNFGEQLRTMARYAEAIEVFQTMLATWGDAPSEQRCRTLNSLGRCLRDTGQAALATGYYREGLKVARQLEATDQVKEVIATLQTNLGDVLIEMGQYEGAKLAYETSLAIAQEVRDVPRIATVEAQLGYLALAQGDFSEAQRRYQEGQTAFHSLQQPGDEAVCWHQLGYLYQEAKAWDAAERAYREAAQIYETLGNLTMAAQTWNQIAIVNQLSGQLEAAEAWFRKAIKGARTATDRPLEAKSLHNLAELLRYNIAELLPSQTNRLSEARQLAEEALAIKETLDPASTEIWTTYYILAEIADKENNPIAARGYRWNMRESKAAFAGTQYELRRFAPFIEEMVAAINNLEKRSEWEEVKQELSNRGWENLVGAINRILEGERDEEVLCEVLRFDEVMIVMEILRQLRDRES